MDQFVAEGYAQKLCIRYVSGPPTNPSQSFQSLSSPSRRRRNINNALEPQLFCRLRVSLLCTPSTGELPGSFPVPRFWSTISGPETRTDYALSKVGCVVGSFADWRRERSGPGFRGCCSRWRIRIRGLRTSAGLPLWLLQLRSVRLRTLWLLRAELLSRRRVYRR